MAMCRKYGKPLFPSYDVQPLLVGSQNLLLGQALADRPDLAVEIFKLKLKMLSNVVNRCQIFSRVEGFCFVRTFVSLVFLP